MFFITGEKVQVSGSLLRLNDHKSPQNSLYLVEKKIQRVVSGLHTSLSSLEIHANVMEMGGCFFYYISGGTDQTILHRYYIYFKVKSSAGTELDYL